MNFALTMEQSAIQDTVKQYCEDKYSFETRTRLLRAADDDMGAHWRAFAELGWLGVALPQEVDGLGGSAIESALILHELGRALVCEPYLACAVLAAQTLSAIETQTAQALLRKLVAGQLIIAVAHTESGGRGLEDRMESRAHSCRDGNFVLRGQKLHVLGGGSAQKFLVLARLEGDSEQDNCLGLFLVDLAALGVTRRRYRTMDEHESCDLQFRDVPLSRDDLLAHGAGAVKALKCGIEQATIGICAEAVGAMEGVINTSTRYLKSRSAYGTTLSTFQALQHKLADMFLELELSRSALYNAIRASFLGECKRHEAISAAKALIGQSGHIVGAGGIQLHGGMGMAEEYIVGHYFKKLVVVEQQFGSSQFHLNRLAASLLGPVDRRISN